MLWIEETYCDKLKHIHALHEDNVKPVSPRHLSPSQVINAENVQQASVDMAFLSAVQTERKAARFLVSFLRTLITVLLFERLHESIFVLLISSVEVYLCCPLVWAGGRFEVGRDPAARCDKSTEALKLVQRRGVCRFDLFDDFMGRSIRKKRLPPYLLTFNI